jgi:predicted XRE-type DNA-binding protein
MDAVMDPLVEQDGKGDTDGHEHHTWISIKTLKTIRPGGKNIFEDLKLPDAEELNANAQIAYRICQLIQKCKITQQEAASVLSSDQPRVSTLPRSRLEGFSSDRLFRFLDVLDQEIENVIHQTRKRTNLLESGCWFPPESKRLGFGKIVSENEEAPIPGPKP